MNLRKAPALTIIAGARSVLGLSVTFLSVYLLGPAAYGRYSVGLAVGIALMSAYSSMFPVVISKLVSAQASAGIRTDRLQERAEISRTALLLALPGITLLISAGLIAYFAGRAGDDSSAITIAITLIVVSQLITQCALSIVEGAGRVRIASVLALTAQAITFLMLASYAIAGGVISLKLFMLLVSVAALVESLCALGSCGVHLRGPGRWFASSRFNEMLRAGFNLQAAAAVNYASEPVIKLLLAGITGPAAIATFDLANKIATGIQAIFSAYTRLFQQLPPGASQERQNALRTVADLSWVSALLASALISALALPPIALTLKLDESILRTGFVICALVNWLMLIAGPMFVSLINFGNYRGILLVQLTTVLVTITSAAGLIYLIGLTGAFLGLLIGMTCAVPLIERQYARQTMEHRVTLGGLARPMASRISTALLVLIVPASLLEWASVNRTIYWLAEAIVVLVILGLLMREPIWRTARQLLELRWFQ